MPKHINLIVHRMKYFLIDRDHVNKVQVISFTVYFWFHRIAAVAVGLSERKASSYKREEAVGVAAIHPLPHCQHPQFEKIDAFGLFQWRRELLFGKIQYPK